MAPQPIEDVTVGESLSIQNIELCGVKQQLKGISQLQELFSEHIEDNSTFKKETEPNK